MPTQTHNKHHFSVTTYISLDLSTLDRSFPRTFYKYLNTLLLGSDHRSILKMTHITVSSTLVHAQLQHENLVHDVKSLPIDVKNPRIFKVSQVATRL